jgi:hypothetical protein
VGLYQFRFEGVVYLGLRKPAVVDQDAIEN